MALALRLVTWCWPYISFFCLILAQHCAFVSSFNRELKQRHSTHVNKQWDLVLSQYAMKPKFLLVQLSAFSLIERFSREFWLDVIILLGRILPKDPKCTFGSRASGSKRRCSSTLLKCWSLFTMLSQLCLITSCRTLYRHFSFSLDLLNPRQGAWISDNPVHARRLYIPWFLNFLHFQILVMQYIQWTP